MVSSIREKIWKEEKRKEDKKKVRKRGSSKCR